MAFNNKQGDSTNSASKSQDDQSQETLREKATRKLHGPNANPSQLGDPISLKAETSDNVPTDEEGGSKSSAGSSTSKGTDNGKSHGGEKLREKAVKKIHGPDANPSQLGDPISIKAETSDNVPTDDAEGSKKTRDSKL